MTFFASNLQPHSTRTTETLTDLIINIMKVILAIPAAGLLLSSTFLPYPSSDHQPMPSESKPTMENASPAMWTDASACHFGDNITLRFSTPHPQYHGVVNPDGKFFYVVFPESQVVGALSPLVDSEKFVNLDRLVISTATLKADPYIYGVLENQPVFTKSGAYTFILGDNLHVDDPGALFKVRINYKHVAKPQPKIEVLP